MPDEGKLFGEKGAGLGHILKLHNTPIDLVHPGAMALDPVVKSDSCAGEDARVLEHVLNQNLPIRIPAFQPGLDRIRRCIMSRTTAGGEDQNPHQLRMPCNKKAQLETKEF